MANEEPKSQIPHVVIIPSPGMGHLNPLAELAKRLIGSHNVTVSFVVPTFRPPSKPEISVLSAIDHVFLPPPSFHDLPQGLMIETIITLAVTRSLPNIRDELNAMTARGLRIAAVVVDMFGTDAFDVAIELGIAPYVFFTSSAALLSLLFHLPKLDETVSCEYRDLTEPIEIPGCIPFPGSELFEPLQDRKNHAYRLVLHNAKRFRMAEGVMVNSFEELEPGVVSWLLKDEEGRPRVYPVGPLINMDPSACCDKYNCLTWLDGQPRDSVLFVSFGSGGTLSSVQVKEVAMGLEMSGQRFLWNVRRPNDAVSNHNHTYLSVDMSLNGDSYDFLPEGFIERTRDRGFVFTSWAPQAQILAHESTGGFLSHCGWNSTLESVVNGVPLIVWPIYAEQKMNAFLLENDVKVGLRFKKSNDQGLVKNEEIARVVKALIEGEEGRKLRSQMKELKEAASRTLCQVGASTKAISQVVDRF